MADISLLTTTILEESLFFNLVREYEKHSWPDSQRFLTQSVFDQGFRIFLPVILLKCASAGDQAVGILLLLGVSGHMGGENRYDQ